MTEASYLAGRLLVAMPGMADPNFERSVTALYIHDERGAFGVGIGHLRAGISFHDVLSELGIDPGDTDNVPVHHGGPVHTGAGFVLHTPDWQDESTIRAASLGGVSSSIEVLSAIASGQGPKRWIFALGYAGWGEGQLDEEMRHHGWYAAEGRPEIIFGQRAEKRWQAVWDAEGIDPALLAPQTGTA